MASPLGHLSKNMLIYGGGLLLKRGLSFLMIPFYTRWLRPADYGLMELFDLSSFVAAFVVGLGLMPAMFRFHAEAMDDPARRRVKTNALLAIVALGGPLAVALVLAAPLVSYVAAGDSRHAPLAVLVLAGVFFSEASQLLLGWFRVEGRAAAFALFSLGAAFLGLVLNVVFVAGLGLGVAGIFLSSLVGSLVVTLALSVRALRGGGWTLDVPLIRGMLAYALPLIPSGLMAFLVNFADRWFLRAWTDMGSVGVYALGYKLGMAGGILIAMPFHLVWSAQAFEIAKEPRAPQLYGRILTYYTALLLAVNVAVIVLAPDVLRIMAPADYAGAAAVVPIVGWGILLLNLQDVLQVGVLLAQKTRWLPLAWGLSAAVNLGLNALLIPRWGMLGAAWATFAAFATQAVAVFLLSNRWYRIEPEWGRLAAMVLLACGLQTVLMRLPPAPVALAVAAKSLALAAGAAALLAVPGFVRADERASIRRARARLLRQEVS